MFGVGVAVVVILVAGWFWYASYSSAPQPAVVPSGALGLNNGAGQTNTGQTAVAPALTVASSGALGKYLVADNGMTLYTYAKDSAGVSNCSGVCAVNWPPYRVLQ
ncbi:MAG: hypothetical protein KGI60_04910, partial [Patescibacteria group bacterium]|nr:hypothetical protein [Patescibacteria group bacterium]